MRVNSLKPEMQGILMHSCSFARCGILHCLNAYFPDFFIETSDSFRTMGQLSNLITADIVVSDIYDNEKKSTLGLDWLVTLQHMRGNKPLVIIAESLTAHQLNVLSGLSSISLIALQTPEILLIEQLRRIISGEIIISSQFSSQPTRLPAPYELTVTEMRVLELLHAGFSVTQIANRLSRSVKTVSAHKRNIMTKLRVDNEISLFSRVNNLSEKICCLDNGQTFVRQEHLPNRELNIIQE